MNCLCLYLIHNSINHPKKFEFILNFDTRNINWTWSYLELLEDDQMNKNFIIFTWLFEIYCKIYSLRLPNRNNDKFNCVKQTITTTSSGYEPTKMTKRDDYLLLIKLYIRSTAEYRLHRIDTHFLVQWKTF